MNDYTRNDYTRDFTLAQALDAVVKAAERLDETANRIGQIGPDRQNGTLVSFAAATEGGGAGATAIALTADQRVICERVINVFESGSIQGNYSAISIYADGPNNIRQVTYGRAQTTEYGNLRELVQMYVAAGGTFSNELGGFVDRIGRVALVDNDQFKTLLRRAGAEDQVMRDTQDKFFDLRYFQPALHWADTNGFSRALSVLVIYDSFIQSGGILELMRSRFPEPIPARGGNEQTWVRQYVDVRRNWLQNHPRPAVRASVYRMRDLGREVGRDNWDLAILPIMANGVAVDTRPAAMPLVAASGQPPAGVPYFPPAASDPDGSFAGAAQVAEAALGRPDDLTAPDDDPGLPLPGETDDLHAGTELANFGDSASPNEESLAAATPAAAGLLSLDLNRAYRFLDACRTSVPRVTYKLGKKVPSLAAVPGRDFTQVDCSGFIRQTIRLATTPPLAFPDGSVNQHDWVRAHGFARSTIPAAMQSDGFVRIAFLRPQDAASRVGHVVLVARGKTLESHSGVGPDARTWNGFGWQAKAFVYVLARDPGGAGGASVFAATAAPGGMFTVHRGRRYRATLRLSGFEQIAGNDLIGDKLTSYGFKDVVVTGSGATRIAIGTWGGNDTTAQLDPHIVSVEELPS